MALSASQIVDYAAQLAQREAYNYETNDFPISKFSPDDIPSNFLGTRIAATVLKETKNFSPTKNEWTGALFNETVKTIDELGPLSKADAVTHYDSLFKSVYPKGFSGGVSEKSMHYSVSPVLAVPGAKAPEWFTTPDFDFYKK